tara:strand:- start:1644 stop:1964 length:321 start_codon:yes stop_codon:yes gene_type:complete
MIPFIRSFTELMVITKSRDQYETDIQRNDTLCLSEESGQRKRYLNSEYEKKVDLPVLPKTKRRKWIKSKEAISRFFDNLDYSGQIQSSYDLTLLERQRNYDYKDVA